MLYLWIAVLVAAVVVEALTNDFVAIWFFPAAVVSMVLSLFDTSPWLQLILFLSIGLVLVVATRPFCRKFRATKGEKTNVDAMVGKTCLVTEEIRNIDEVGEVKLGGLCWSARSADGRVIAVGEQVTVKEVQGVKLIVE